MKPVLVAHSRCHHIIASSDKPFVSSSSRKRTLGEPIKIKDEEAKCVSFSWYACGGHFVVIKIHMWVYSSFHLALYPLVLWAVRGHRGVSNFLWTLKSNKFKGNRRLVSLSLFCVPCSERLDSFLSINTWACLVWHLCSQLLLFLELSFPTPISNGSTSSRKPSWSSWLFGLACLRTPNLWSIYVY